MKLIFFKILIAILLLNITISFNSKNKLKNKQLFEMMEKSVSKDNSDKKENGTPNLNSLFEKPENKSKDNKNNSGSSSKNLFDSINFNEVKEKKVENENKNMSTNLSTNTSSSKNNSKNEARLALKNKLKFKKYSKEIEKLKNQIHDLMGMNEKLTKRVSKFESKKLQKIDDNVISFIENYDQKVDELKTKLKSNKKNIQKSITEKEQLFSDIFSEASQKFTEIKSNIKNLNKQVDEITNNQSELEEKVRKGLEIDNLNVNNNLNIKGILYSKKLSANELDIDNIKINSSNIKIEKDTQLQIGNDIFTFDGLIKNFDYISKLRDYCGDDFSACRLISKEDLIEQSIKQENILKNLKKLRIETADVIDRRHKKSR